MDYKQIIADLMESVNDELDTMVVLNTIVTFPIVENPVGYRQWEDKNGGMEVTWDDDWEHDVLKALSRAAWEVEWDTGTITALVDIEINGSLGHEGNGAAYEGEIVATVKRAGESIAAIRITDSRFTPNGKSAMTVEFHDTSLEPLS